MASCKLTCSSSGQARRDVCNRANTEFQELLLCERIGNSTELELGELGLTAKLICRRSWGFFKEEFFQSQSLHRLELSLAQKFKKTNTNSRRWISRITSWLRTKTRVTEDFAIWWNVLAFEFDQNGEIKPKNSRWLVPVKCVKYLSSSLLNSHSQYRSSIYFYATYQSDLNPAIWKHESWIFQLDWFAWFFSPVRSWQGFKSWFLL